MWQMPMHREPTSFEILTHDFLRQVQEYSEQLLNSTLGPNETLEYWWNHPHRRPMCLLSIIFAIITIWLIISSIATRRALQAHVASQEDITTDTKTNAQSPTTRKSTVNTGLTPEISRRLRETQALDKNGKGSPSSAIGTHVLFGIDKTVDGRTGRVSTPKYQTLYANNAEQRSFSGLAIYAPANYFTLQQNGVLDAAGTPTRKFSALLSKKFHAVTDEEGYVQVFDSPTWSYGRVKKSKVAPKEVQHQGEGI